LQRDGVLLDLETCLTHPARRSTQRLFPRSLFRGPAQDTYIIDQKEESAYLLGMAQMCQRHGRRSMSSSSSPLRWRRATGHMPSGSAVDHLCVKAGEQGASDCMPACLPTERKSIKSSATWGLQLTPRKMCTNLSRRHRNWPRYSRCRCAASGTAIVGGCNNSTPQSRRAPYRTPRGRPRGSGNWAGALGEAIRSAGAMCGEPGRDLGALHVHSSRPAIGCARSFIPMRWTRPICWWRRPWGAYAATPGQKLYCAVRTYEAACRRHWLAGDSASRQPNVVVKQTTVWAREPAVQRVPALESHAESMTPSTVPHQNSINPS